MRPVVTQPPDRFLLGAVVGLVVMGVLMVYSASFVVAHNEFQDDLHFLSRQLMWIGLGGVLMLAAIRLHYHRWRMLSLVLLLLSLVALVLVLVPGLGVSSYGAVRWLRLGPLPPVQPSEFAKFALVVYLSDWLARKGPRVSNLTYGSIPFAIIVAIVAGLVMMEPDLGTTLLLGITAISIFFVAGANLVHFILGLGAGGVAVYWMIMSAGYRSDRLRVFLDPWKDPQDSGWHTIQTLIALGSGGLNGLGLGMSRQKAYWVPNAHTDAIFAIIGEELGLIGTVSVLALFGVIAWRGMRIAFLAPDLFGRLMAVGLTSVIVWQGLMNIAVVTNTVPYTGVPLPFVSFGGSSLLVSMLVVGVLLSISRCIGVTPRTDLEGEAALERHRRTQAAHARREPATVGARLGANVHASARRSLPEHLRRRSGG